jgi:phospholipid/cholesterol/gamma-HCH transport system substrate-binding protein
MVRYSNALYTGTFVVFLGAALIAVAIWLGNYGEVRDLYLVTTEHTVSGLNQESSVYYRGVNIGKVTHIDFDPTGPRTILVGIEVKPDAPITKDTYAMLRIQPLTGLATIELNNGLHPEARLATSHDHPARIPMRLSSLQKLMDSGASVVEETGEIISRLNKLFTPENRAKVEHLMGNTDLVLEKFISLEDKLDKTLVELPAMTREIRATLTGIRAAAGTAKDLAAAGQRTTEAFSENTLPKVQSLIHDLEATSGQVRALTGQLERNPQSVLFGAGSPAPGPGEPGFRAPNSAPETKR